MLPWQQTGLQRAWVPATVLLLTCIFSPVVQTSNSLDEGSVWTWGHNVRGQLGLGDGLYGGDPRYPNDVPGCSTSPNQNCDPAFARQLSPRQVPLLSGIRTLSAGSYHTIAVSKGESLVSWGWNLYAQLGTDSNVPSYGLPQHPVEWSQRNLPTDVRFINGIQFQSASGGIYHSMATTSSGEAYSWGINSDGQLCLNSILNQNFPQQITSPSGGGHWVQVAAGHEHSVMLASNGIVYACGANRVNQLGRPATGDYSIRSSAAIVVPSIPSNVVKISSGQYHSLALGADGLVYAWGDNRYGQVGIGGRPVLKFRPVENVNRVQFFTNPELADLEVNPELPDEHVKAIDIAAGAFHNIAFVLRTNSTSWQPPETLNLVSDHFRRGRPLNMTLEEFEYTPRMMMWGNNQYEQLGVNSSSKFDRPFRSMVFETIPRIRQIAAGNYHNAFLTDESITLDVCKQSRGYKSSAVDWMQFCAGSLLFTQGRNVDGELGVGTQVQVRNPTLVPESVGRNFTLISLGLRHSVALAGMCPFSSRDACGVCFGVNSTCLGCDAVPNSGRSLDSCDVCGGDNSTCAGCDGIPNSGAVVDECGICGGDSTSCMDCARVPNGVAVHDVCGICGGDGSSCTGCDGVPGSGKGFDACEVCGGNNDTCALLLILMEPAVMKLPNMILLGISVLLCIFVNTIMVFTQKT